MALMFANLDRTCKPCDDFHQFAVGGWLKNNPIPAQYPVWGSFHHAGGQESRGIASILESAAAKQLCHRWFERAENRRFLRKLCMDTKEIDAQGIKPIGAELAASKPFVIPAACLIRAAFANARCRCAVHFRLRSGFQG